MARQLQAREVPENGAFQESRILEGELIECQDGIESASPKKTLVYRPSWPEISTHLEEDADHDSMDLQAGRL